VRNALGQARVKRRIRANQSQGYGGRLTIYRTPSQFFRCGRHFRSKLATPKRIM